MVLTKIVQLRELSEDDVPALLRFLTEFEDGARDEAFWARRLNSWWKLNPAYEERIPRGWVVAEEDRVSGFFGNIPSHVLLKGKPVTAYNATTWRVLPECRNNSLRLFYQAVRASKGSVFFNTTPSDDVIKILEVHKFRLLPHAEKPMKSVIVVNARRLAESRVRGKVRAAVAAFAGAPAWSLLQSLRLRFGRIPARAEVRQLIAAGPAFDELWSRTGHLYANTNVRSSDAVQWMCFSNPEFPKPLFGCFLGDRLTGYLIGGAIEREGLKVLRAIDVWLDPEAPFSLGALLRFVKKWAAAHKFDTVEVPHFDPRLASRLTGLGLLERAATGEERGYYQMPGSLDAGDSYFVSMQGDYGL
jgi:hypothetical protein